MPKISDLKLFHEAKKQLVRRHIDSSRVDLTVINGVIYIRGPIFHIKGEEDIDLKNEIHLIERVMRQIPGINGIVNELEIGVTYY